MAQHLDLWHRGVAGVLRGAYFGRVRVTGQSGRASQGGAEASRPRLILSSHRNGAVDGLLVQRAFPHAQYLLSLQLLRNPVLRLVFTGIPVVRPTDVARYGMDPSQVTDPIDASVDACGERR